MERPVSLILAVILLITCSGCFWGWEHDQEGTMTEIAEAMVSMTVEGTMTEIVEAMMTGIDMTTAETLMIIDRAMTNRDTMSGCW